MTNRVERKGKAQSKNCCRRFEICNEFPPKIKERLVQIKKYGVMKLKKVIRYCSFQVVQKGFVSADGWLAGAAAAEDGAL